MDADFYVDLINHYFIPRANELYGYDYFLHQDYDPKHTSGLVANFLQHNHIRWVKYSKNY